MLCSLNKEANHSKQTNKQKLYFNVSYNSSHSSLSLTKQKVESNWRESSEVT